MFTIPTPSPMAAAGALLALTVALGAGASQADTEPGAGLDVAVHARGAQPWQRLGRADAAALERYLERAFRVAGFAAVNARWCGATVCGGGSAAAQLVLEVALAEARPGALERGIAFSIGNADARQPGLLEGTLMPIGCRLRTPAGRLVAARESDAAVPAAMATGRGTDGEYLASRIVDACVPLLPEQRVVVLAPQRAQRIISTADPQVYLEQRIPAAANAVPVAAAARTAHGQRAGEGPEYVLHNKGDTVYLEFGRQRR